MSETDEEGQAPRSSPDDSAPPSSKELAHEAAVELMGLEKRLLRTVLLLVSRPGMATLEYCRGARSDQVSPVRLYIVVSAVYFGLILLGEADGFNLGIFTLTEVNVGGSVLRMPTAGHALVLISAVPFFAACLRSVNDSSIPYAEYLVFALYFQCVVLMSVLVLELSPLPDRATTLLGLGVLVAYVSLSARRLWGLGLFGALWLATVSLIIYGIGVAAAGIGATLLYNWLF